MARAPARLAVMCVAGLVMLVGACARPVAGSPPDATSHPAPTGPLSHLTGPTVIALPTDRPSPIPLVSDRPAGDVQEVTWHLTGQHGRTLIITASMGACARPIHAWVDESPTSVTVEVFGAPPPRLCTLQEISLVASITLSRPLGDRRLVHS